MDYQVLRDRTKAFALRVIRLVEALPDTRSAAVLGRQLLRSATSIGANYRESRRASSHRHFVSILQIALREADETLYWLELVAESGMVKHEALRELLKEAEELVAIFAASVKTSRDRES